MLRRSGSSSNYSTPTLSENWGLSSRDYGVYTPNSNEPSYGQHSSGSHSLRTNQDSRGAREAQRSFGRRTSGFGSDGFPARPHSSIQVIILDSEPPRESSPLPMQIQREAASPRPRYQWNLPFRRTEEHYHRSSSRAEPNKALENLRKELYNPNSKRITTKVNLYYRDTPVNPKEIDNDKDSKRCAVCLEDFERGEEVLVTPCKHMFHEECIVPWVKSNNQCPVCRSVLGQKTRESANRGYMNTNNTANVPGMGLSPQELYSIIRALGDGFQWAY